MKLIRWVVAPLAALLVGFALVGVANAATQNWVVDFEGLAEDATPGALTSGAGITGPTLAGIVTVSGTSPMIFDATCAGGCSGGDTDLNQPAQGNVLIISEDGDSGDPDDSVFGGALAVAFTIFGVVTINSMYVMDQDDEGSASIQVFNGVTPVGGPIAVPATGDGGIVLVPIGLNGTSVVLTLEGSGAMGDVSFSVDTGDPPPPPDPAEITVVKAGGEAGVTYNVQLTHGLLENVDPFNLQSGDSHTQILFLGADYVVVELGAPAGVTYSSGCSGGPVLPGSSVTCTVTNPLPDEVLGTTAIVEKLLTSADPAFVGESVTFVISTTISGDTTVASAGLLDVFEHAHLGFVSADPACQLFANMPDASHSTVACDIGEVTPGTSGSPGSLTFSFELTFEALQPTSPGRTVNSVVAVLDDQQVGPATDDVEIIQTPTLPPAGDGSLGHDATSAANIFAVTFATLVLAVSGLWLAQGAVMYFGTRELWERDQS